MLLILAGVSLSAVFSERGIFNRAENATGKYSEAKAKEILETVLMADAQTEKYSNPKYNQDDFLDELIQNEIPGSYIKGDVVILDGWAFDLDRSVPKIGYELGRADELVFPEVNATVKLAEDKKNATIEITALEETNGINKIEIWQLGEIIKEYTYEDVKTEITVNPPYTAIQNGTYTIKVYGNIMASKTVKVEGILASVKFEPNLNEEWKKSHTTTVTIQETADKVVSAKYYWINSVTEPTDDKFIEEHTFKSGDTITGEALNGTNYLWIMLETQSGEKIKRRSEGFNYDNQAPNITSFTTTDYSLTGITLSATAQDTEVGIAKFEFYVDGEFKGAETCEKTTERITKSITVEDLETGTHTCKVVVYDYLNNSLGSEKNGATKPYSWNEYSTSYEKEYYLGPPYVHEDRIRSWPKIRPLTNIRVDSKTGVVSGDIGAEVDSNKLKVGNYVSMMNREDLTYSDYGANNGRNPGAIWCEVVQGFDSAGRVVTAEVHIMVYWKPVNYKKSTFRRIVTSFNANEYPRNGEQGGYWYEYINE